MSILEHFFRKRGKIESRGILLSCLWWFTKRGQEEISLPQILDSVQSLQRTLPLGYEFSRDVLYSRKLFEDIGQLEENGYIRRYEYFHDGLLPKGYVALTVLGRGRGEQTSHQLDEPTRSLVSEAVEKSIAQHKDYWRLYPRI